MTADDCTVALCVPVSVVKQRRLDLIDGLQLRGSTVFCTSIPGICRAQQRQSATAEVCDEPLHLAAKLSFWFIAAMTQSIWTCQPQKEHSAR